MQDDFEDGDNDMLPVDNDALSFVEKSSSSCSLEGTPQDKDLLGSPIVEKRVSISSQFCYFVCVSNRVHLTASMGAGVGISWGSTHSCSSSPNQATISLVPQFKLSVDISMGVSAWVAKGTLHAAFSVIDITTPVVLRATSEQKCFSASQMRIGKGEGGEVVASGKIVGTDGEGYRERQLVSWKGVGGQFPWFTNDQCSLSG